MIEKHANKNEEQSKLKFKNEKKRALVNHEITRKFFFSCVCYRKQCKKRIRADIQFKCCCTQEYMYLIEPSNNQSKIRRDYINSHRVRLNEERTTNGITKIFARRLSLSLSLRRRKKNSTENCKLIECILGFKRHNNIGMVRDG